MARKQMDVSDISVGMPCTVYVGSDSYGGKVVAILGTHTVLVDYNDHSDPTKVTLRKDGSWRTVGKYGGYVSFGKSVDYRDPSF